MNELKENPLAPVDGVLNKIGLPGINSLLDAISPENVLGHKLGLTSPGEVLEGMVVEIDSKAPSDGISFPKLPRMR